MWLADEQHAGRLRMSPRILVTSAELRTPQMTHRLVEAFGVHPFNVFACTEGLFGSECEHHQGIHLLEDTTLVENVDPDGQPVPAGEPGARLLVTNLYNLVQPLLRLEVTDLVTLDPDPCPCGRILARMNTIHGRSDDILSLPARDGSPVAIHPLHFALLSRDPKSANSKSSRTARSCASSSSPAHPTQLRPPPTNSRPGSTTPSPTNSAPSASTSHTSASSAAESYPAAPAASSNSLSPTPRPNPARSSMEPVRLR